MMCENITELKSSGKLLYDIKCKWEYKMRNIVLPLKGRFELMQ